MELIQTFHIKNLPILEIGIGKTKIVIINSWNEILNDLN